MLDLKIINGEVMDGTGHPAQRVDVGIRGEDITDVGDLHDAEAARTIDAKGKTVAPGFIDVHTHSDAYLLIEPSAHSKIYQGVTTEVVGNCGASAAPTLAAEHLPFDWTEIALPGEWKTVAEYRALIDQIKPGPNAVLLAGHNTLRRNIVGYENRPATESELANMCRMLEQAMDEGARGFSTGLIYAPGRFAQKDELIALMKTAAKKGGLYATHMRNEGSRLIEAIREAVEIGRAADCRIQISHLKVAGQSNWGKIDEALELIHKMREEGVPLLADRYPYTFSSTELDMVFPDWAAEGGNGQTMRRLRCEKDRRRLHDDLLAERGEAYWGTITIGSTHHPDTKAFKGRPLTEAAEALGVDPVEAVLFITERDELHTGAYFQGMHEDNMKRILGEPYVMPGSDASLRAPTGPLSQDHPHPRAYGTFPRYLRTVLDNNILTLPEAVRKMTSLPAEQFGLSDRGILARGKKADIVVFDPSGMQDTATCAKPHSLAEGVAHVIVNGVPTLQDRELTGTRGGRFL